MSRDKMSGSPAFSTDCGDPGRRTMSVGTKSLLFGAHLWFLHPWFVALAWWKLYGPRTVRCNATGVRTSILDPRLWLCFAVHDWGYWGCPDMDGPVGERHPLLGARIVRRAVWEFWPMCVADAWRDFALYHSRFLAKQANRQPSLLCAADKLAIALEPWWLYLPRVRATGEIKEYMRLAESRNFAGDPDGKYSTMNLSTADERQWHASMTDYVRRWAFEHRDGRADTWTPERAERNSA